MRWPVVSRFAFDTLRESKDAVIQALEAQQATLRTQCEELTKTVCAMKMQGAAPVRHAPDAPVVRELDAVSKAIREVAGRDASMQAYLRTYAAELRSSGEFSEEQIAEMVGQEESSEQLYQRVDPIANVG